MPAGTALIKLLGDVSGFSKSLTEAQRHLNSFGQAMTVAGARATASFTVPLVMVSGAVLKFGSSFETAMAKVKKTIGAGSADLGRLEETMLSLSKQTTFSSGELAEFARIGAQLGVGSGEDINKNTSDLIAFTRAISDLAIAANELPAETAAKGVAKLINVAGEDISKDVGRVTNTLALLGDSLPTSEERILNFSVLLSGLAKVAKMGTAELMGIAGGFASVVNGTERAASSVQALTSKLVGAILSGGKDLEEFATIIAKPKEEIQALFHLGAEGGGGLAPIIEDFLKGLKRISEEGGNTFAVLEEIGLGNVKVQQTFLSGAGGIDNFTKSMELATTGTRRFTKAQDEVKVIMETVAAKFETVKNRFEIVFIKLFGAFGGQIDFIIEKLSNLADWLIKVAERVNLLPEFIKTGIVAFIGLAAAIGPILFALGSFITTIVGLLATVSGLQAFFGAASVGIPVLKALGNTGATAADIILGRFAPLKTTTSLVNQFALSLFGLGTKLIDFGLLIGKTVFSFEALAVVAAGYIGLKLGEEADKTAQAFFKVDTHIAKHVESIGLLKGGLSLIPDIFGKITTKATETTANFIKGSNVFSDLSKAVGTLSDKSYPALIKSQVELVGGFASVVKETEHVARTMKAFAEASEQAASHTGGKDFFTATKDRIKSLDDVIKERLETPGMLAVAFDKLGKSWYTVTQNATVFANATAEQVDIFLKFVEAQKEKIKVLKEEQKIESESAEAKEKQAALTAEHQKEIAKLIDTISQNKVSKSLADMTIAFEKMNAAGLKISADGGKKAVELIKDLQDNGQKVPSFLRDIALSALEAEDKLEGMATMMERIKKLNLEFILPGNVDNKGRNIDPITGNKIQKPGGDFTKTYDEINRLGKTTNAGSNQGAFSLSNPFLRDGVKELEEWQAAHKAIVDQMLKSPLEQLMDDQFGKGKIIDDSTESLDNLGKSLKTLSALSQIFKGSFGKVITEIGSFASGIGSLKELGKDPGGGGGGLGGLFGGLGSMFKKKNAAGEVTGGLDIFSGIASAIPLAGALIGPAISFGKALFGAFHKSEVEKIMENIGKDLGTTISEKLAKEIEDTMKADGIGQFEAVLLHLGDILNEAGGANAENIDKFTVKFNDLLNAVALGTIDAAKGIEQIEEVFPKLVEGFESMGFAGQIQIGILVNRMKELGTESKVVEEHMKAMAEGVIENFTPMINLLNNQFKEGLLGVGLGAVNEVESSLGVLVATFGAAVEAAGGLGGAIALLPESFGELLTQLREIVGNENEALNSLTAYYNFAKENSEVLSAIDGLILGMGQLAEMGLLNANNINALTASATMQMNAVLESTENQTMALIAMGPQIGELLEMYKTLGIEAPEALQALADKALEAGANLTPPEGIEDILADIRDILYEVATAFGVAGTAAAGFNTSAGGARTPNTRPPKDGIPTTGAAKGFSGTVTGPHNFFIEPGVTEDVEIGPSGSKGGIVINVSVEAGTIVANKEALAQAIGDSVGLVIKNNLGDTVGNIETKLEGKFQKST